MTERFAPNDIVQLGPNTRVPGGLAVVTEIRRWGVICYVQLPGPCENVVITIPDNRAWFRLGFDEVTATGGKVEL